MNAGLIILGCLLITAALIDIFLTVLYARAGSGFLAPRVHRLVWAVLRRLGAVSGRKGDRVLSFAGPVALLATVITWFGLLWAGFALIAWPALGTALQATGGRTPADGWTALYYAGYSLTTLGTGDIVPKTATYRILMVIQALVGFSVVTLSLTYFMSVYSALVRRNTLAQTLHHLAKGTADPAVLLAGLSSSGRLDSARSLWANLGTQVLDLLESHHSYPVLHYFRMRDPRYAMARIALLVLDPIALARSALDGSHQETVESASASVLWGAGLDLLRDTGGTFLNGEPQRADEDEWRRVFAIRWSHLQDSGLALATDRDAAAQRYVDLRKQWAPLAYAFAQMMITTGRPLSLLPDHEEQQDVTQIRTSSGYRRAALNEVGGRRSSMHSGRTAGLQKHPDRHADHHQVLG
jgi:hypothetical protein